MEMWEQVAQAAGWFMVTSFAILLGGAALTGLFVLVRLAWRS